MKTTEITLILVPFVSGATVHLVDENYDSGEVILQKSICVKPDDTAESLSRRVLDLEHGLIVKATELMAKKLNSNQRHLNPSRGPSLPPAINNED